MSFKQLGIIPEMLRALKDAGYTEPTPIQAGAIGPALAGRDVLGLAQTGTGKTAAFAIPVLQLLNQHPVREAKRPIRALILTPTRELAIQINESIQMYGTYLKLRTTVIFGGVGQAPQVQALRRGTDILVATPGRLLDLMGQKEVQLDQIQMFILDEADRMLDMGFIHDVKNILKQLPKKKQTMCFSATMPDEVAQIVSRLLKDPVEVAVTPVSSAVELVDQAVQLVDQKHKPDLLIPWLKAHQADQVLIFTRTKHGADKLVKLIVRAGLSARAIHGNKSQSARQQALAEFKEHRVQTLVATDIAARGLDIQKLAYVVNYDLPEVPETYVHRIGRSGRAGAYGHARSLVSARDLPLLKDIEKLIRKKIRVLDNPDYPMQEFDVVKKPQPVPKASKKTSLSAGEPRRRSAKTRAHITPGLTVRIVKKEDQRTGKTTEGVVAKILTNSPSHPHGIKVMLTTGEVGRVSVIKDGQ